MKENLEILHKVLVKLKLSEPVPTVVQKGMLKSKKRILVKILKSKGSYNFVAGATLSIFFAAKQIGLGLSVAQSAVALAAASLIAAGSVAAGSYTVVKKLIIPSPKTSSININKEKINTYNQNNNKLNLAIDPQTGEQKQTSVTINKRSLLPKNKQQDSTSITNKGKVTTKKTIPKKIINTRITGTQSNVKSTNKTYRQKQSEKKQVIGKKASSKKRITTHSSDTSKDKIDQKTQTTKNQKKIIAQNNTQKQKIIPQDDFTVRNKNAGSTKDRHIKESSGKKTDNTGKNSKIKPKDKDVSKGSNNNNKDKKKKRKESEWMFHVGLYGAYHQPVGFLAEFTDNAYGYGILLGIENCIFDHFLFGIKTEYIKFNFNDKLLSVEADPDSKALTFLLSMSYRFKLYHNFFIAPVLDGGPLGAWVIEPGMQVGYIFNKYISMNFGLGTTTIIHKDKYLTSVSLRFGAGFSY